jgi:hypothetical protein
MGGEERGEGGEYDGECLYHNNRNDKKYNDDNKYNDKEDGKGLRRGADKGGESNFAGHDIVHRQSFSGVGWGMLIFGLHAAAAVINDKDVDNNCRSGGGVSCPPPLVGPVPPDAPCCRQCC